MIHSNILRPFPRREGTMDVWRKWRPSVHSDGQSNVGFAQAPDIEVQTRSGKSSAIRDTLPLSRL
jgi:hypothetical protein